MHPVLQFHLAEINIARALEPLDHPVMADFVAQLETINLLAEQSPGFVWRLKGDDDSNSLSVRAYQDELILVNMSVWESLEALKNYAYLSGHAQVFRNRAKWFSKMQLPSLALWWIPAGTLPTAAEGRARLEALERDGPTPKAFHFRQAFPPPST